MVCCCRLFLFESTGSFQSACSLRLVSIALAEARTGLLRAGRRRVWPGFRDANEHYGNTYLIFSDKRKHRAGVQRQTTTSKGSLQAKRTKEAGWRKMFLFSLSFTFTSHSGEKLPSLTGNKLDNSLAVHCSISILSRLIQRVFFSLPFLNLETLLQRLGIRVDLLSCQSSRYFLSQHSIRLKKTWLAINEFKNCTHRPASEGDNEMILVCRLCLCTFDFKGPVLEQLSRLQLFILEQEFIKRTCTAFHV